MKKHLLAISRATKYSPNSIDRDAAIFASVCSRMNRGNNDISVISEDLYITADLSEFDLVFSMARGRDVLQELAKAEAQGLRVVNSAHCLLKMSRAEMIDTFQREGIPCPKAQVGNPAAWNELTINFPLWLKRTDACAQQKGDVCKIDSMENFHQALNDFATKGITHIVAEEHIEGDLVKFYGVEDTDFFYATYPTETDGFSKFGLEKENGIPQHYAYDKSKLKQIADQAARVSGLTIYGGDAVVREDGSFAIIDFNDWPSFSSCRKQAAKAIATRLKQILHTL